MDLKSILSKGTAQEHYWALVIETGWIQAGVWKIENEKAEMVAVSPATPWETEDDLISASDTVLSAAIQNLPEEVGEPSKTVFGVPPFWVTDGQIKPEFLEQVKKICTELSLEPTGFVVLPEAIAHLMKAEEGSPLSAVVLEVGSENLELAVFKLGNLVGTASVQRSLSVYDDVVEGLSRFVTGETLPSRFLIYNGRGGELEEIRQNLLSASWNENEKIKFLHTPKIEIIEADKKVVATALAGASEMSNISQVEGVKKEEEKMEAYPEETANVQVPETDVHPEDLGFVVDEDITEKPKAEPIGEVPQQPQSQPVATATQPSGILSKLAFWKKIKLPAFPISFKKKNIVENRRLGGVVKKKPTIALLIAAVVFLVGGFLFWWFIPKATLEIFVSPKILEENLTLSVDINESQSDFDGSLLAGKLYTSEESGEKTTSTSGTKTIGEKAKGSVKIQNGTAAVINLPAGTILYSASDLKFTTTSSASVSAALSPSTPGEGSVDVAAYDIGSEYNLGANEVFKIGNYPKSEVDALTTQNFSGGSSREIPSVSSEDQAKLEKELTNELTEKAIKSLGQQIADDRILINATFVPEVVSKVFSAKVGDEATNLKLSLKVSVSGVSVAKTDMFELAKKALNSKIPTGYALKEGQIDTEYELVKGEEGVYELTTILSVNLLPEVKVDEITSSVLGKYPALIDPYLATAVAGYTRANIKIKPSFPGKLKTMPRVLKNITVIVSAER
jgi:hypothetical protein